MATSITGSVSLTYGTHFHSESFSTTTAALTNANEFNDYAAGGGRAVVAGAALAIGTIGAAAEGLLLIKNDNNIGALSVSLDAAGAYDISIPAKVANLISVGGGGAVHVKVTQATITSADVVSASSAGAIVFDGSPALEVGTAIMTATSSGDDQNDYIIEIDSTTTGTAYELDGITKKDLSVEGVNGYDSSTQITLVYHAKYRYTLTEA
jgi:hypothetical protein